MKQPFYESRHEGPFTRMFEGREIHLVVGALTLEVVGHVIAKPGRTLVKEAGDSVAKEMPDALAGVVYGVGNVEHSRTQGYIALDGDDEAVIPHGVFEELTDQEREVYPAAEWKFSFDYTVPPTVHPM